MIISGEVVVEVVEAVVETLEVVEVSEAVEVVKIMIEETEEGIEVTEIEVVGVKTEAVEVSRIANSDQAIEETIVGIIAGAWMAITEEAEVNPEEVLEVNTIKTTTASGIKDWN